MESESFDELMKRIEQAQIQLEIPPKGGTSGGVQTPSQLRDLIESLSKAAEEMQFLIDRSENAERLSLESIDYQEESLSAEIKQRLGEPWASIPKTVDADKCTECAICKQICPVGAVVLDPLPVFGENCFGCFNCVRECPEEAIVPGVPLEKIWAMIRERVEKFGEMPHTQVFI